MVWEIQLRTRGHLIKEVRVEKQSFFVRRKLSDNVDFKIFIEKKSWRSISYTIIHVEHLRRTKLSDQLFIMEDK